MPDLLYLLQLEAHRSQLGELKDKAQDSESDLGATLSQLQEFEESLRHTEDDLNHVLDMVQSQRLVAGDVEAIRDQQDAFKVRNEGFSLVREKIRQGTRVESDFGNNSELKPPLTKQSFPAV